MPLIVSTSFGLGPKLGCPVPTDDFSSYTVGAFPQGPWTLRENTGTGTSNILASSTAFVDQNLELGAATGALCLLSHTRGPSWNNGEAQVKVASNNPSTLNVQGCLIANFLDTSNFLEFRTRLDTASFGVIINEIVGGVSSQIGGFTPPGGYAANTVYAMNMIVSGTTVRCRLLDENCELIGTAGVNNDFTFNFTNANNGPAGVKRISLSATTDIFFDDFYSV